MNSSMVIWGQMRSRSSGDMARKPLQTNRTAKKTWQEVFLEALAETGNIQESARVAGVVKSTAYLHRKQDPEFSVGWDAALEKAIELLELEARRRALKG